MEFEYGEAAILLVIVLLFSATLILGRWWLLVLPLVGWPVFYAGLVAGWWGDGVGDLWQFAAALVIALSLTAVSLGIVLRGLILKSRKPGEAAVDSDRNR